MSLNGITPYTAAVAAGMNTEAQKPDELGQDEFLQLLLTQLQNQDPLNPMESAEFTAQLAQFNSLEQLMDINDRMESVISNQQGAANAQAVGYIGTTVTAEGAALTVSGGESTPVTFDLARDSAAVFISIYDMAGGYVSTLEQSGMSAGSKEVEWSAADRNGNQVPDGLYTYSISAMDADGESVSTVSYMQRDVTGVAYQNGTAVLLTDSGQISLSDIVSVEQPEE